MPSELCEITIPTTSNPENVGYLSMLTRIERSQKEQLDQISEHFESSIHRLTEVLAGFMQTSKTHSRKRTLSDHGFDGVENSVGTATKVARAQPDSDTEHTPEEDNDEVISLPEQDDVDKDIEKLLGEAPLKENLSDQILEVIAEELGQDEAFGDKISDQLAKIINDLFTKKLPKDKMNKKADRYKSPENLSESQFFQKVNQEIWANNLDTEARSLDLNFQRIQKDLLKITAIQSTLANDLLAYVNNTSVKSDANDLIVRATDSLALIGNLQQEISQYRREAMKHKLPTMYQQLIHNVPPNSKMLFGDDLNKRLQSMSTTNRALAVAKASHGSKWTKHSASYTKNRLPPQRSPAYGKRGTYRRGKTPRGNYRGQYQTKIIQ